MDYRTTLSHGLMVAGALLGGKWLAVAWTMAHVPVWPTLAGLASVAGVFVASRKVGPRRS